MFDGKGKLKLDELLELPHELEHVEFKVNNDNPEQLGEYISALGNTALLLDRSEAYLVFGIKDGSKEIVGTKFKPYEEKVSNQALSMWLNQKLKPHVEYVFDIVNIEEKRIVILSIRCPQSPVSFNGVRYIRVGTSKTELSKFPEKESLMWEKAAKLCFESAIATERLTKSELTELLDFSAFEKLASLRSVSIEKTIEYMETCGFVRDRDSGFYDITNLGALLLARSLKLFGLNIKRKAVRVMFYKGRNKLECIDESEGDRGYACGYSGLIKYINDRLPHNELIGQALREKKRMYPEIAIRELVANALIHQDLTMSGTGPMVEVYEDRVEVSNPGTPLIETDRFIDNPARSRNEALAYQMRQLGICEERGSGIKKVVFNAELYQLPAPSFLTSQSHTVAVLYAHKEMGQMSKEDKIRACYQHSCLRWVQNEEMTNSSLRERFGIERKNYSTVSRLIAEAVEAGYIKSLEQEDKSKKNTKYLPYWAPSKSKPFRADM